MENIIFNELVARGCSVNVGVIKTEEINNKGIRSQKTLEIDFVVNRSARKYYIQGIASASVREGLFQKNNNN